MMSARRQQKGQATTELALSGMVLISMIMAGIYFGELTFGALKVTEAGQSALWDTTHFKHHTMNFTYSNSPINNAVMSAQTATNFDYQDFDGRTMPWTFRARSANITQVFTATTGMNVRCQRGGSPGFTPNVLVTPVYSDNNGVSCQASSDFATVKMPADFMNGSNGFFKTQQFARSTIRMCASGTDKGSNCPGRFALGVDDWGLTGPANGEWSPAYGIPWGIPPPPPLQNFAYWAAGYRGFLTSYWLNAAFKPLMFTLPASLLAMSVAFMHPMGGIGTYGGIPWNESTWYLSFAGSAPLPLPFTQFVFTGEGYSLWETTPFLMSMMVTYAASLATRVGNGGCYLGKRCN
jgi:hypothetical protein